MFEMPLDDDYYPDTPHEEAKLERISELEHLIDEARRNIQDIRFDMEVLTDEKLERAEDLITGFKAYIDDWELEIQELEGQ